MQLVETITSLDADNAAYEEYRKFKRSGSTNEKLHKIMENRKWEPDFDCMGLNLHGTKGNFVDHFDCYLCDLITDQEEDKSSRAEPIDFKAKKDHYGCPLPLEYVTEHDLRKQKPFSDFWHSTWMASYCDLQAMLTLSKGGKQSYSQESFRAASKRCLLNGDWKGKSLD